jgi:5-formaminoimidazole-4-carboxamide-1-beta-D-ribofuranosyl 5'-monophosphate synthetase
MKINEFYEPSNDKEAMRSEEDSRKSKLTLKELNKLRKVREISRAEEIEHTKFVKVMYKTGGEEPVL